jgi:hypothetical protein
MLSLGGLGVVIGAVGAGGAKRSFGTAAVGVGLWGDPERSIWRLEAKAGVPVERG